MKKTLNLLCLTAIACFFSTLFVKAQEILKPSVKTPTTFAIVVDRETYSSVEKEIRAYRDLIEEEGVGTYIIVDHWTNPEQIRAQLLKLYKQSNPLEGTVLIGNIPVVMVRDAQHLTSAFKMNQRLAWNRSSVPSDRFYDDFDMQFEFLNQDTVKGREHYFYYSLKAESPQYIEMDIYSGRIKPPVEEGENMQAKIRSYLNKLVVERRKQHTFNDMILSIGHGYNSNAVNSILGEATALRSQMPHLFRPGGSIKFLTYRNAEFMKFNLLSELKRDGQDFAYMTGHGTATLQLINGYPDATSPQPSMVNVARYLRSKIRDAKESGRDLEEVKARFRENLGVSNKWMDDAFDAERIKEDSIFNENVDIQIHDIKNANIQATVVYSNSCLTGSFHLDNYIIGHYPFSNNKTLAAVASSVGILQDVWPSEFIGILQHGARLGNWLKQIAYLETHVIGDPTFHYHSNRAKELNKALALRNDMKYWSALLNTEDPDLQGLALKHLTRLKPEAEISPILKRYYFTSPNESTRMQAFSLLREFVNADYFEVLHAAKNDPYEFIRRRSVYDLADFGGNDFVADLIELYINDPHSERVNYRIRASLEFFEPEIVKAEITRQIQNNPRIHNANEITEGLLKSADYAITKVDKMREAIADSSLTERERENEIRTLRLYRYHRMVPDILRLIEDVKDSEHLRITALEAMGWFAYSYQRDAILATCNKVINDKNSSEALRNEALKTKNRILNVKL